MARRPGVVTFIAVIMYVPAALAAIAGISLLIWRSDVLDWLEQEGATEASAEEMAASPAV